MISEKRKKFRNNNMHRQLIKSIILINVVSGRTLCISYETWFNFKSTLHLAVSILHRSIFETFKTVMRKGRGRGIWIKCGQHVCGGLPSLYILQMRTQLSMVCRRTAARDPRPLIKGRNSRNNATTNSRGRNSTCGDLETAGWS